MLTPNYSGGFKPRWSVLCNSGIVAWHNGSVLDVNTMECQAVINITFFFMSIRSVTISSITAFDGTSIIVLHVNVITNDYFPR